MQSWYVIDKLAPFCIGLYYVTHRMKRYLKHKKEGFK